MEMDQKRVSRKRFVAWGMGIVSFFALTAVWFSPLKRKKHTVKMLGEDGKLVEIDASALSGKARKISTEELQNWVKK